MCRYRTRMPNHPTSAGAGSVASRRRRAKQLAAAVGILVVGEVGLRLVAAPPSVDFYRMYRLHGADGFAMLDQMGMSVALVENCHRLLKLDEQLL